MNNEITSIIDLAKQINLENILENLKEIINYIEKLIKSMKNNYLECENLFEKIFNVMQIVMENFQDSTYKITALSEIINHFYEISQDIYEGVENFKMSKYYKSGLSIGKGLKLALIWNYSNSTLVK